MQINHRLKSDTQKYYKWYVSSLEILFQAFTAAAACLWVFLSSLLLMMWYGLDHNPLLSFSIHFCSYNLARN